MSVEAILFILAAMTVAWFAKAVTGVGGPMVAIPLIAGVLGVQRAVIVLAIPGVVGNVWLLLAHRSQWRFSRDLPVLLITGVAGTAVGTVLLLEVSERLLAGVLAGLILAYLLLQLLRPGLHMSPRVTRTLSPLVGATSGLLQGSTGISAPVVATYLHGLRLVPATYVFSAAALFGVFAVAQVGTLAALRAYDTQLLLESLLALIPLVVTFPLGIRLSRVLSSQTFGGLVLGLLAVMAAKLLWDAMAG